MNSQHPATGSRPRLLVVASTFPTEPGDGTPSFVADLAAVEAEEFDTTVLVPAVRGSRDEDDGPVRIRRFRYFFRRYEDLADGAILENLRSRTSRWLQVLPFLLGELVAMRRLVRQARPDVVHVHWLVPQGIAAWLAARGIPWLLTCHGADVYALRGPFSGWLKRRVLSRASAITTVNEDMRQRVIALGADPARTHVLPMPAAELIGRQAPALATGPADSSGGVDDGVPGRIVFVGRLVEKKGVAVLLEALRLLPAAVDFSCEIVGDGPLRAALERRADGLSGRVTFLGRVDKRRVSQALADAQVVVVPSVPAASGDQDGLPVTLLEAMAGGRGIVASRLPGIAEAVEHERTALLVPPGDAGALAEGLNRLLTDPSLRRRLAEEAAERASDYTPASIGARYNELLRSLLKAEPGS